MEDAEAATGRVERRVRELIKLISGVSKSIQHDTELYADLLISGDDAAELIETIERDFGISFAGLHLPYYFPNEVDSIIYFLYYRISRRKPRFRSFTFGHLLAVIEQRQWFEPHTSA